MIKNLSILIILFSTFTNGYSFKEGRKLYNLEQQQTRQLENIKNHFDEDSIFYAIKMNDVESVKKYIADGIDINQKNTIGEPILVFTLSLYPINLEILKLILAEKPDIDLADKTGNTPLIMAARAYGDQVAITQMILDEKPKLELMSSGDYTALFHSVINNNVGVVELLIYAGSDVNTVSENYYSHPLCYAAAEFGRNSKILVKLLLEAKAVVDARDLETGRTALMHTGDVAITEMLYKAGADVNAIDNDGYNALMLITHSDIIEFLLKKKAKVNVVAKDGSTAIMWAIEIKAVKALIEAGENVNAKDNEGRTAMLYMDQLSGKKALDLVKAGADVNARDKDKRTALMLTEDTYLAKILIDSNIKVDAKDKDGKAALLFFARLLLFNDKDVVTLISLLGNSGANFKTKDNYGNTALHYIVERQDYTYASLIDTCLKYGSDIDAQNKEGNTPLMWAAIKGHTDLILYLKDKGADLSIKNNMGYTAKDLLCACEAVRTGSGSSGTQAMSIVIDTSELYAMEPLIEKLYCFSIDCPSAEILTTVFV